MKSDEYWALRRKKQKERILKHADEFNARAEKAYAQAMEETEKVIAKWYRRFADNNQIDMATARKWLTDRELKELRWSLSDYIKAGKENGASKDWTKELENASARVHISRYEALLLQCRNEVEQLTGKQLAGVQTLLGQAYKEQYENNALEIALRSGGSMMIDGSFGVIDTDRAKRALQKPWSADGKTFSERIWEQQASLTETLSTGLARTLIRGEAPDEFIEQLAGKYERTRNEAARLVYTESSALTTEADKDCYAGLGITKAQIHNANYRDGTVICRFCKSMNGKVIELKGMSSGVTAPPFHPWCGCYTTPYQRDWSEQDADKLYEDWDAYYGEKEKTVANGRGSGIIDAKGMAVSVPKNIQTVDFSDESAVKQVLSEKQAEWEKFNHEMDCTVTVDGRVWITSGTGASVNPTQIEQTENGISLVGSYSYHNHPDAVTNYSFSGEDVRFFFEHSVQYQKASDSLYEYEMWRTEQTEEADYRGIMQEFNDTQLLCRYDYMEQNDAVMEDEEAYHAAMKVLSQKYHFAYVRRRKG